jgi:hypothetical protein
MEVCCCIMRAIIVNTWSFFDNIKLADDFLENGKYMKFPVSMLDGDYAAIKHGIKIQYHNFPHEWPCWNLLLGPQGATIPGRVAGAANNWCNLPRVLN